MAILIDPPRWPAHQTLWSHLVSDASLDELHAFAADAGIPLRGFDHDHYDVPERRYADLVTRGAIEVPESELIRRLAASGLRTRTPDRIPKPPVARAWLQQRWQALMPDYPSMGAELLERWSEPHRVYHDVRHLAHAVGALDVLNATSREVVLAAWFHDAVYEGRPGVDEEASAELAVQALKHAHIGSQEIDDIARLVLLTIDHSPEPHDLSGAALVDADLSILGAPPGRYHMYARNVRLEYAHVDDAQFERGRRAVLDRLINRDPLFHTTRGRELWGERALFNMTSETDRLGRIVWQPPGL